MKLKFKTAVVVSLMAFFIANTAHALTKKDLHWSDDKRTVTVLNTIQFSKPSTKWDTQTSSYKDPAPVKWVYQEAGPNPEIFLRYRADVTGKTAHAYANQVKDELAGRGIHVYKTEDKVINGRNVAILYANSGEDKYMVGVWRHKDLGFLLECKAHASKFYRFMYDFNQAISSVRVLQEAGY